MNRLSFQPTVNGARTDVEQNRRFVRSDHAARLDTLVASLLRKDERPLDDYDLRLSGSGNALQSPFHGDFSVFYCLSLASKLQSESDMAFVRSSRPSLFWPGRYARDRREVLNELLINYY